MEDSKRQRCVYVTARQKKKLLELMNKHPELISCKVTQNFNHKDSQRLWQSIAIECNSIPGARKTWKQWRKTWHDLRSNMKKKQAEIKNEGSESTVPFATATEESVGVHNMPSSDGYEVAPEFVHLGDNQEEQLNDEMSTGTLSDPDSPVESKSFIKLEQRKRKTKLTNGTKDNTKHANNCYFNCDLIAVQEQRKIDIKESYLNFKKDYLKQKLKLLREQTEALKSIAKELSK